MKRMSSVILCSLLLAMTILPVSAQDNTAQSNKELVRNALAELSGGNPQAFYDLFPDEFMMNQGNAVLESMARSDVEGYNDALMAAIPDFQMIPDVLIAQNDWIAAEITLSGTFSEPLFFGEELAPTGEAVQWTEMDFLHFNEDGQIIEVWSISDPSVMFSQLGLFPPNEDEPSGTMLEEPAGYQQLSEDELAVTFTSGMEERNTGLFKEQLVLGEDTSKYYTDTYTSWTDGVPYSVVAADQAADDIAFTGAIASALPDHTVTPDVIVAEGDWVASLVTVKGTFTEDIDFFGTTLTHTDEEIVWQVGFLQRYDADGRVVEEWIESDASPVFMGLGLMPPMGDE